MKRPCRGKGGSRTSWCGGSHPARPWACPGTLTCVEMCIHPASSELGWAPSWGSRHKSHCYTHAWCPGLLACDSVGLYYIHSPQLVLFPWGSKSTWGAPFAV